MSHKRKSFLAILGQGTTQGFALISMLIMLRLLSREEYGVWALYLTILSIAEMARAGFVQNGLVSFLQSHAPEQRRIIGSAYALNLGLGLLIWAIVAGLAIPLGHLWDAPELPALGFWYGLFMLSMGALRFLDYIQIARQDFLGVVIGNVVFGGGQTIGLLLMLIQGYQPRLVELIWLQGGTALLGFLFVRVWRRRLFTFGRPQWSWVKRLANYGRFVLGTNVGSMLLQRVDVMMIGFFLGAAAVAPYNVAMRLTNYLEVPLRGLATSVFPRMGKAWNEEGPLASARLHDRTAAQMLMLTLPVCIGLGLLAEPIIWLVAGDGYGDAVVLLRILLLFAIIKPWGRMFGTTLDAIGRPKLNFVYVWVGLGLNAALNALCIPWLGVAGAAWATVSAMLLMVFVTQWQLQRIMPVRPQRVVRDLGQVSRTGLRMLSQRLKSLRSKTGSPIHHSENM